MTKLATAKQIARQHSCYKSLSSRHRMLGRGRYVDPIKLSASLITMQMLLLCHTAWT